jgi:hypothetical protein
MEAAVITIVNLKAELGKLGMLSGHKPEMTKAERGLCDVGALPRRQYL